MSVQAGSRRLLACNGCRTQLLRSFLAVAGVEVSPLVQQPPWQRSGPHVQSRQLSYAAKLARQQERESTFEDSPFGLGHDETQRSEDVLEESGRQVEIVKELDDLEANEAGGEQVEGKQSVDSGSVAYVPWYLQEDAAPARQEHPFSERHRIPELPESPPPLLQPLMQYVSVDLGIDDLSLLDLRSLDPPPALGSNLLMIIGTARSEKHLHVSADRLCRWLRSNHSLSPFADGLLGRNEMKLKIRRKAKRTRMLSAVGAKATGEGDVDDGIRTGWVCVNVGKVEGGVLEKSKKEIQNFVGFSTQTEGSGIVVQMMTDEKRGQIDLEALWTGILRRSKKEEESILQEQEDAQTRIDNGTLVEGHIGQPARPVSTYNDSYRSASSVPANGPFQQARAFHTSRRLQQRPEVFGTSATNLRQMLDEIKAMETREAQTALGDDFKDKNSTSFLTAFYDNFPPFADHLYYTFQMELYCHAISINHPGYPRHCVATLLTCMEEDCSIIPQETFNLALTTLLNPTIFYRSEQEQSRKPRIAQVFDILDKMNQHGHDATNPRILQLLTDAHSPQPILNARMIPATAAPPAVTSPIPISDLLPTLSLHPIRTALSTPTASLSHAYEIFTSYPRRFLRRGPELYTALLDGVADRKSAPEAVEALRLCVPAMKREEPAVDLVGDVARAVGRCVLVVEPEVRRTKEDERGEWAVLWRRVKKGMAGDVGAVVA